MLHRSTLVVIVTISWFELSCSDLAGIVVSDEFAVSDSRVRAQMNPVVYPPIKELDVRGTLVDVK